METFRRRAILGCFQQTREWHPSSLGRKDAERFFSWGTPGGLDATIGDYTGDQRHNGARAQQATTELLQQLLVDIPGARVVHAVEVPGRPSLVIDHVVLAGSKIPGAPYCWSPYGDIAMGTSFANSRAAVECRPDVARDA